MTIRSTGEICKRCNWIRNRNRPCAKCGWLPPDEKRCISCGRKELNVCRYCWAKAQAYNRKIARALLKCAEHTESIKKKREEPLATP